MNNVERLEKLRTSLREFDARFPTQEACVHWAAQTAPLLNFNRFYYQSFQNSATFINFTGLSSYTLDPQLNNMRSMVVQAITELENGLTPSKKTEEKRVEYPARITAKWLNDHVPFHFWGWAIGILAAAFLTGVAIGSSNLYKDSIEPWVSVMSGGKNDSAESKAE